MTQNDAHGFALRWRSKLNAYLQGLEDFASRGLAKRQGARCVSEAIDAMERASDALLMPEEAGPLERAAFAAFCRQAAGSLEGMVGLFSLSQDTTARVWGGQLRELGWEFERQGDPAREATA